jgi:hypothetical protein
MQAVVVAEAAVLVDAARRELEKAKGQGKMLGFAIGAIVGAQGSWTPLQTALHAL